MKKTGKYFLVLFGLMFVFVALLIFRPVSLVPETEAISEKGIVADIYSNNGNDVIFVMENTSRRFYINRGLETGLDLADLKAELIGNPILVKYPKYWTPLDWNDKIKHVSKVEYDDEILFSEFNE